MVCMVSDNIHTPTTEGIGNSGGEGELGGGSKSGMIFNVMFSVVLKILVTISFDFDIN